MISKQGSRTAGVGHRTPINVDGHWFVDEYGRSLLLRGVNLGGSSKQPIGCGPISSLQSPISFVGRPFPLHEADEHYGRLRHWGCNCLRFLTTWEAVEHAAPEQYDEAYLDYLRAVVKKADDYGFYVFIDPHQDVWSRFSGGDGAPAWTLELAGFNLDKLDAAEAAVTMPARYPHYGKMVWSSNRRRLASATMFTLFFAGERFAPHCLVAGEAMQDFLQRHFIAAMQRVAERVADLPHVIGYDSLNEPSAGYIGLPSLSTPLRISNEGPRLTGFETMVIPAGFARSVPYQQRRGAETAVTGEVTLNPAGVSAWRGTDVWRQHGVWDVDRNGRPVLLQDDYFAGMSFFRDCLAPFAQRYAAAMRAVHPDALLFVEGEPHAVEPMPLQDARVVNASHWYDSLTLRTKHYNAAAAIVPEMGDEIVMGKTAVQEAFRRQLGAHMLRSQRDLGGAPTLIGEFGLSFDLDGGAAYRTGDFQPHEQALAAYYDALDFHLLHSTLWNYTADNDNVWGDQWNGEDLSIFSRDQQANLADPDSGSRALRGFCRPTLRACAGRPLQQRFDLDSGKFILRIQANPNLGAPTLLYLPHIQYPNGFVVTVGNGRTSYNSDAQLLAWETDTIGEQLLTIERQ